jgi:hypothetical protein
MDRDEHDEGLARLEAIVQQLRTAMERFREFHERTIAEARLVRFRAVDARLAFQKERRMALEQRWRRATQTKR